MLGHDVWRSRFGFDPGIVGRALSVDGASREFQRRFFPGETPVGRGVILGRSPTPHEIVGVVGDVRHDGLAAAPAPFFYLSTDQRTVSFTSILVRTGGEPLALGPAVRARVAALDADQPVGRLRTLRSIAEQSLGDRRFALVLLALFAGTAFVLAATGLFGVLAYLVSQRTPELGIRMALGAGRFAVVALVLRRGLSLAAAGLAIGLAAAVGLTRLVSGLLFGVGPADPLTLGAVAALLLGVAVVASAVPALRAERIDPLTALREE